MRTEDERERARHRTALSVSWLAYASSYLGRKGFSAVKKPLQADLGLSTWQLGLIDTAFLGAYAAGQFVSGVLADRFGARRVVGIGLLGSAGACCLFGFSRSAGLLIACFALNGLFQAAGWPGNTRVVAEWTPKERRGLVMSRWSTCYQVGGFVATPLAVLLALYGGLRAAFFGPALVLAVMGAMSFALLRSPRAAGEPTPSKPASRRPLADQLVVFRSPLLWFYGTSYFFIKLVRYGLLFWLPYYLAEVSGHSTTEAGFIASAFDAGGVIGVLAMGPWSDRSRFTRAGLSALWLVALAAVLGVYGLMGRCGVVSNVALLGLIGALLFGPDSLLSGAAAMDVGGERAAATSAGFVNGLGSLGALLQGLVVPAVAAHFGWRALFPVFLALALLAALVLVPAASAARRPG